MRLDDCGSDMRPIWLGEDDTSAGAGVGISLGIVKYIALGAGCDHIDMGVIWEPNSLRTAWSVIHV